LIVLVIFPLVAWAMRLLAKRLYSLTEASPAAIDKLADVVEEERAAPAKKYASSMRRASSKSAFMRVGSLLQKLAVQKFRQSLARRWHPSPIFLAPSRCLLVITVAIVQSQSSALSAGGFVAFITAMLMLIAPIKHLSEVSSTITRGVVAAERAIALIESVAPERSGSFCKGHCEGHITFEGVGVRYPDAASDALSHIDLRIAPGRSSPWWGLSGSGKTTLANLLPRFVDCTEGHVLLDGVDLREWDLHCLRQQFALVGQNVVMLNDSVLHNVALGQPLDRQAGPTGIGGGQLGRPHRGLAAGNGHGTGPQRQFAVGR